MARLLRMPEVAANAAVAVLSEWPVAENASFTASEAIATIETEKAVVDVPAESDGVMLRQLVQAGAEVAVGEPIALLGDAGDTAGDVDALLAQLGVLAAGSPAPSTAEPDPVVISVGAPVSTPGVPAPSSPPPGRVFSSPLARRLARDAGLEVQALTGSGPGGRIVRRDVEQAIGVRGTEVHEPPPDAATPTPNLLAYQDIPHTRMRRAIASRLTQSMTEAPHFYLNGSARVDKLLKLRATLNDAGGVKVSVNDLVLLAAARSHVLVPAMNVTWLPDAVRSWSSVDLAVAVATERGLVTPVLRGVERLTVTAVATATQDLVARARGGRLREDELAGGTLTVTNLGGFGTESFSAILNPPQSAILAVGAARPEPVVRKGRVVAATVLHVTLSVDHRPIDGVVAAQWMAAFLSLLEEPVRILA